MPKKKQKKTPYKRQKYAKFKAGFSDRVEERRRSISKIDPNIDKEILKRNNNKINEFFRKRRRLK